MRTLFDDLPPEPPLPVAPAKPPMGLEAAKRLLKGFIARRQLNTIISLCRGEEGEFFQQKLIELATLIRDMPKTYQQDGLGDQAIASLHYFAGGQANWWITEKDMETEQHQAFGRADLFGDGGSLGYISIVELIENNAEIDLYFTPQTLAALKAKDS